MILNQGFQNSYFIWFSYSGVPLNSANLPVVQHHLVYIVSSSVMSALLASASISLSPSLIFKRPSPEGEGGGGGLQLIKAMTRAVITCHCPVKRNYNETVIQKGSCNAVESLTSRTWQRTFSTILFLLENIRLWNQATCSFVTMIIPISANFVQSYCIADLGSNLAVTIP